jgi:hypothetical protein
VATPWSSAVEIGAALRLVSFIVPALPPSAIFGTFSFVCSSSPWRSRAASAPCVRPGYMAKDIFAEEANSFIAIDSV